MRMLLPALLILTLAGCGGDAQQATGATAQGEVLPGSASDAMIPLDQVKSQAPLAPRAEGGDKKTAVDPAKASADAAGPVATTPAEEPAAQVEATAE